LCATADLQAAAACGSAVAHKVRSYRAGHRSSQAGATAPSRPTVAMAAFVPL